MIGFGSCFNRQLCVLVAGAIGGRFDHEAGNINVLYLFSTMRIILVSDDCLIYLLPKAHHHEIYIQSSVEGPHCGLIPIGMPSGSTTTTGLQWDLSKYIALWYIGIASFVFCFRGLRHCSSHDIQWWYHAVMVIGEWWPNFSNPSSDIDILPILWIVKFDISFSSANAEMTFGGLVSTSNIVRGERVTVQSSSDLLWTISIKKA